MRLLQAALPFLLPKTNTIHDLADQVLKNVKLSPETTGKIRLFAITKDGRHQEVFSPSEMLGNLPDVEIFAEVRRTLAFPAGMVLIRGLRYIGNFKRGTRSSK